MSSTGTVYLLTQLGYSAPSLIVYGVAFVLALVYRRRAPRASTLTLSGVGVLVCGTIAGIASSAYLVHSMSAGPGPASSLLFMGVINFSINCLRAAGLLLLVVAIFAGRGRSDRPYREPEAPRSGDDPRRGKGEQAGQFREGRAP